MSYRSLPVHPDLSQLRHQAKDLLRALHANDLAAVAELAEYHPERIEPVKAKLADAQVTLARSYGVPSWPRLVLACNLTDAIWAGDLATVRKLVTKHPSLLRENARGGIAHDNWGYTMSYAANVGQDEIVRFLRDRGADDVQYAFDRACLRGKIDTARLLLQMGATVAPGSAMGPAESLNGSGMALLVELGAPLTDASGDPKAPVAMILETYSRNPDGKHCCLELVNEHGMPLPDTPTMAVHRGRLDLLKAHVLQDPDVLHRQFTHEEIYPPELGCHSDHTLALHGTPLAGGTLLHLCVDFDEWELATWLLENGANVNAKAAVDADGFGGHTALFGCVVSQTYRTGLRKDDSFARMLLEKGADPNIRASLRKQLRFVDDETLHEFRNVTPYEWGQQFQDQDWVNPAVMALLVPTADVC
jgi:ankyrin repeat protein